MLRTVTGEIPRQGLGNVLIHEHIRCASNDMLHTFGKEWLDEDYLIEYASKVLTIMKQRFGIGLFVDGTPIDVGRDIRLLRAVSERSEVPIVASTGLYWYPSCVTSGHSADEIAEWFLKECRDGAEGTDSKPGILKCATDELGFTQDNVKRLTALGIAQRESGLPLYVHSRHTGDMAEEQLHILCRAGANPEKVIIGHAANRPDADYLEGILKQGCYIAMDQCLCFPNNMADIACALIELCKRGYANKILLSNDICIYTDFGSRKNTGFELSPERQAEERFGFLFNEVYSAFCELGGNQNDWDIMLCENSVEVLDV